MSNIPTAEEFLIRESTFGETRKYKYVTEEGCIRLMKAFAEMHRGNALETASELKHSIKYGKFYIDKEAILNCYPPEKIK